MKLGFKGLAAMVSTLVLISAMTATSASACHFKRHHWGAHHGKICGWKHHHRHHHKRCWR